jgi:hypothetical protein
VSYVVTTPDFLATAAEDLAAMESAISTANVAAATATTSLMAAGADEVSARVAAFFGSHAREYQAVSARAAQFGERFVSGLAANATAYLNTELTNTQQTAALPAATTRITLPGAGPLYMPRFITELPYLGLVYGQGFPVPAGASILQAYDSLNVAIGQNWFPNSVAQVVNYPASVGIFSGSIFAPTVNEAVATGQQMLNEQIMTAVTGGTPVQIAGLSMGTLVVNRELAFLATSPTAPPPDALQFAMFSSPELGLVHTYLPNGFTVPIMNYTAQALSNTQYNVDVAFGQYDGFGNPPDRPWNLLSVVNSLFGTVYNHNMPALLPMSDAVQLSSVTMPLGGTVNTYMFASPTLPMLLPLQQIGVPQPIVNGLNSFLKPIVDAGYSSLDPNAGPYFLHGSLVGVPTAADVLTSLQNGLLGAA